MSKRYQVEKERGETAHAEPIKEMEQAIHTGKLSAEVQGYVTLVQDLIKSSGIYAISSLAAPLIALVLAPFLTRELSTTDYGALVVLNTMVTLVTGVTQLGLISAVFRTYNYDYELPEDRKKVLSATVLLLALTSFPVLLLAFLVAPWLAALVLGKASYADAIRVSAVVIAIQNFSIPGLAWLRAEKRVTFFSVLSIVNLLVALGATIFLVGAVHMGINGSLWATGAGYAVIVVCTLPLILLRSGLASRKEIFWNLLSFGIPLVFNTLSFWVLQFSDRYLLGRLGSLSQTASYGVAYNLGGALNVVILAPFTLAWPTTMFAIAKKDDAPQMFQFVFRWFSIVILLAGYALSLMAVILLDLLFPPSYHSTASLIPIIALSIVFYGVYNIFTTGTGVRRKTWYIAIVMTLAAILNVVANLFLIPLTGAVGAALSTLIAYIFLCIVMYVVNQRIYPLPFQIGLFMVALLVGIALYVGTGFLTGYQTNITTYAIYIGSTLLYAAVLLLLGRLGTRKVAVQEVQEKRAA